MADYFVHESSYVDEGTEIGQGTKIWHSCVGQGASIGANMTVVCGVTLGQCAFVGAGAVVTRDVPDYALVYGTPARIEGWMCQCGIKLQFVSEDNHEQVATCINCGRHYTKRGPNVRLSIHREVNRD